MHKTIRLTSPCSLYITDVLVPISTVQALEGCAGKKAEVCKIPNRWKAPSCRVGIARQAERGLKAETTFQFAMFVVGNVVSGFRDEALVQGLACELRRVSAPG